LQVTPVFPIQKLLHRFALVVTDMEYQYLEDNFRIGSQLFEESEAASYEPLLFWRAEWRGGGSTAAPPANQEIRRRPPPTSNPVCFLVRLFKPRVAVLYLSLTPTSQLSTYFLSLDRAATSGDPEAADRAASTPSYLHMYEHNK
jgi:hypothetical protein